METPARFSLRMGPCVLDEKVAADSSAYTGTRVVWELSSSVPLHDTHSQTCLCVKRLCAIRALVSVIQTHPKGKSKLSGACLPAPRGSVVKRIEFNAYSVAVWRPG